MLLKPAWLARRVLPRSKVLFGCMGPGQGVVRWGKEGLTSEGPHPRTISVVCSQQDQKMGFLTLCEPFQPHFLWCVMGLEFLQACDYLRKSTIIL